MINQQITDYIKAQLQQGISREQIKSSLMANGWQEQDIEENFRLVENLESAESSVQPMDTSVFISNKETEFKPPALVRIVSFLMLLGGFVTLLGILPFLLLGGFGVLIRGDVFSGMVWLSLIEGVSLVVLSFGIRRMRRWALYIFTGLTLLLVIFSIYFFITSSKQEINNLIEIVIQIPILIYFWIISKKFI